MPEFVDKINPSKTAVLVIDMTNGFVAPNAPVYVDAGNKFAPKLDKFLDKCREKNIKIIYTTHIYRDDMADVQRNVAKVPWSQNGSVLHESDEDVKIYPPCGERAGEIILKKHHYSAFYNTDLDVILRANNIDTLIITGVCTDVCCFATSRDAFFREYKVIFAEDLTGSPGWPDCGVGEVSPEETHLSFINNLAATTAQVMSGSAILNSII